MRRPCRGFTLVELLVVIGIITVLIAMLLPSLNRARQQAQITQCASNMRQIATAMLQYSGDNQGALPWGEWFYDTTKTPPPPTPWSPPPTGWPSGFIVCWDQLISPYLGPEVYAEPKWITERQYQGPPNTVTAIMACPSDNLPRNGGGISYPRTYVMPGGSTTSGQPGSANYTQYETYGVGWYAGPNATTNPPFCTKLSRIQDTAGTLLLVEAPGIANMVYDGGATCYLPYKQLSTAAAGPNPQISGAIHGGLRQIVQVAPKTAGSYYEANFNYAYCDGHVDFTDCLSTTGTSQDLALPKGGWTTIFGD